MRRRLTINFERENNVFDYEEPKEEIGPYIVDDSCFIPMSEAVSQLNTNALASTVVNQYFDFPTGKDSGMSVPITRTKNGKDIAEISSSIMEQVSNIADKKLKAENALKEQQAFEAKIQSINNQNTPLNN